jgi:tryptophanyl-tRNA synthetase
MKGSGYLKPAPIHSKFIVGLAGIRGKINSIGEGANMTLYLNDDVREIKSKIKKHADSGGKDTRELQKRYGANLHVNMCYQYLTYFLDRTVSVSIGRVKNSECSVISKRLTSIQQSSISRIP